MRTVRGIIVSAIKRALTETEIKPDTVKSFAAARPSRKWLLANCRRHAAAFDMQMPVRGPGGRGTGRAGYGLSTRHRPRPDP